MEIFIFMVPLSIILIALAIWIFSWAVKDGQYDDLEGPAHSILFEDDKDRIPGRESRTGKETSKLRNDENPQ